MEFKRAAEKDIDAIISIIKQAQAYFKTHGINQWQNNYPNVDIIANDIRRKNSYALFKDNILVSTAAISFDGEKSYEHIYKGRWISNSRYAVIHRVAVESSLKGKGLASILIKNLEKYCARNFVHSIKIDTHKDNISMQKLLKKNKFQYCGIIYLPNGDERMAFEKII
ncbi:GNAT family N-acetyltransferase [Clostridium sp.]|uniref:GNAT family N-acetyltransferase n=1 Tax=Clostridium sp. TaxID=1506 RepID=UPI003A5C3D05